MALNGCVMKVNQMIEKKNKKEAERAGKAVSRNQKESLQQNSKKGKISRMASSKYSQRNKSNLGSKTRGDQSGTLINDLLGEEDLGFEDFEKQERNKLREIDNLYLINEKDDDEMFLFRGAAAKQKPKTSGEFYEPMVSPYIPAGTESISSQEQAD